MISNDPFYHGIIRQIIVAFGHIFSDIHIERKQGNSVKGPTIQTLQVPIAYAPKEKWLVRLEQDPDLDKHTYTTLPRISFEIVGYSYDSQRKLQKAQTIRCVKSDGSSEVRTPVPYNLDIQLYVLTKTQEDALQIIEQILPHFGPEHTVSIRVVPEMNIIQDVPITLNSVSVMDEYDGDFQTRRNVTHTLTFTAKLNLYGGIGSNKPIYHVDANLDTGSGVAKYTVDGDPITYEIINETWLEDF